MLFLMMALTFINYLQLGLDLKEGSGVTLATALTIGDGDSLAFAK